MSRSVSSLCCCTGNKTSDVTPSTYNMYHHNRHVPSTHFFTGQSNTYQDGAFHSSHSVQDTWESIPHIKQVHCLQDKSTVEQIFKLCACIFMQQMQRVCDLSCDCLCFYGNNFSNSCIHWLPRYSELQLHRSVTESHRNKRTILI